MMLLTRCHPLKITSLSTSTTASLRYFASESTTSIPIAARVCIVGSGPAGFYTAQSLLKAHEGITVDIIERLPVPFGLVRYGVAPDHPDVKNVTSTFESIMTHQRCQFHGHINVGTDVKLEELRKHFNVVVLATGASGDRKLNIPGENAKGVVSARDMVAWYNGEPSETIGQRTWSPDLSGEDMAIVGMGNVAVDIARILLSPLDRLRSTDISKAALDQLSSTASHPRRVHLVGRRGPLEAAFTTKEIREVMHLNNVSVHADPAHFLVTPEEEKILNETRPRRRLYDLLKTSKAFGEVEEQRSLHLHFFRSPLEVIYSHDDCGERAIALKTSVNQLSQCSGGNAQRRCVETTERETIPCSLVCRSIGYFGMPFPDAPYDIHSGVIPNHLGAVIESTPEDGTHSNQVPGLYVAGWAKRGPVGVIASTIMDARQTAECILEDMARGSLGRVTSNDYTGWDGLSSCLRNTQVVSYTGWKSIEEKEKGDGEKLSKCAEKIHSITDMLSVSQKTSASK